VLARYAVVATTVLAGTANFACAETPAAFCKRAGTDDTTRPIPQSLVPAANAALTTQMPAHVAMDTTVFRCTGGQVLVCTVGANLPCGKANTSQAPGYGVVQWCREHPDAEVVPAVATGHDTIYRWRCRASAPKIVRQTLHVDPRGFVAEFWKTLP
jgi:hypothetical protein